MDNAAAGDIRVAAAAGRVDCGRCVRSVLAPCRAPVPPLISRTPIPADGLNLISHFFLFSYARFTTSAPSAAAYDVIGTTGRGFAG